MKLFSLQCTSQELALSVSSLHRKCETAFWGTADQISSRRNCLSLTYLRHGAPCLWRPWQRESLARQARRVHPIGGITGSNRIATLDLPFCHYPAFNAGLSSEGKAVIETRLVRVCYGPN
jgi:hypothetical protein